MLKKNFLIILSIFTLSLSLISCNNDSKKTASESNPPQTDTAKPTVDESKDTVSDSNKKPEVPNETEIPKENTEETESPKNTDVSPIAETDSTSNVTKENRSVRLYFYDVINDNIVYYDDTVEVTDKAVTSAIINALKYPSNPNIDPNIKPNINVTSAKLDNTNNTFTVDFPSNFVSEMNLGGGVESSTLKAIVNTLGYNFNVNNVIITLGGNPYSSGHMQMSSGESFKVSFDNTINLN